MGEYAVAKTSVWWDIENCCVPRSCDPQLIVQNMSSALATAGYRGPISVSAYGDTHQIANNVQHALSSTGVSLHHVPAGIKDASDKKILVDMLFWAIDNPPPANYLLISGDRDFSNAIHKLKMRRYNILLAQPPNVSQTLTAAAKSVWLWKSLLAGEPPLAQSPYISSTSSGNKYDLDKSKNIVSISVAVTRDANPEVQNFLCDPQSDANSKADKKYEVKQPQEMQTDNVSKPTRRKQKKRSNPGGSEFTKQAAFKKSKGDFHSTEQSKFKQPKMWQLKAVKGLGMIYVKCGDEHRAAQCNFNGDCDRCGQPGHKDRVCKENPNSIVKWMPAHAQDLATSSPGSVQITSSASELQPTCSYPSGCSQQVTPGVLSPSPAPPVAPAPPETGDGLSSGPSPSRVYAVPTAAEVSREDVARPTTSTPRPPMAVPAYKQSQWQGMICLKCGVIGHRGKKCTFIGACRRCGQGHMERVCRENPDSIIKWKKVHAYDLGTSDASFKQSQGQGVICLKCGVVGHCRSKCTYIGDCRHCGQGHMERMCKENSDSIIKWDQAYALATFLRRLAHVTPPASQLRPTWTPPPGSLWQATPAVPTQSPAPAPPHMGVAASSAPARSGVYASPTAASLGKPDVVMQPKSSSHQQVLGQYHQGGTTPPSGCFWQATPAVPAPSLAPATPPPPHMGVAASSAPTQSGVYATPTAASLGKPDVVTQPTSSAPRPPTELLAYQPVLGQYHQVGASQPLPAWTPPPGYFWQGDSVVPHLAPVLPQPGVAASPRPAHPGVSPMLFPFGRPW